MKSFLAYKCWHKSEARLAIHLFGDLVPDLVRKWICLSNKQPSIGCWDTSEEHDLDIGPTSLFCVSSLDESETFNHASGQMIVAVELVVEDRLIVDIPEEIDRKSLVDGEKKQRSCMLLCEKDKISG